jgi:hypothetical protein
MLTVDELLDYGIPENGEIWLHCLDVVDHILKGDVNQTLFRDQSPAMDLYNDWKDALSNHPDFDESFDEIIDNAYEMKKKWQRYDDESGDFQLDSFLGGEELMFDSYDKVLGEKPAVSVIYDGMVPCGWRNSTYMEDRHKDVYKIAAQCESDRRPCRVVMVWQHTIPEFNKPLKVFWVVKDYTDPIFPAIWACFQNNRIANYTWNAFHDFVTGTNHYGNATAEEMRNVEQYFEEDEELIFFGANADETETERGWIFVDGESANVKLRKDLPDMFGGLFE